MSLRAAALGFWRRSNLHVVEGLLRAKNTPALAGGAREGTLATT